MNITVKKKSLGRSRKLVSVSYELAQRPRTLRDLLCELVAIEIEGYNGADTLLHFLTESDEANLAETGHIKFSTITPHEQKNIEKSIRAMELAFEDGLFKVLQGQHMYGSLDDGIHSEETDWTFIKLTFLAGR
ncbi:hypothetical protein ACTHOQ_01445 [Solibacillus silvestris]|uniref:hypothetical protein n=1 Tax=Solibacillus silvestris TaxID=76853 RepID=UPI003F8051AC